MFEELTVDLGRPPGSRWRLTSRQCEEARELLRAYKADLGLPDGAAVFLTASSRELIRDEVWREMESLADQLALPVNDVVVCNLYYDALKVVFGRALGCTAFAVDTPEGVLHARNLDWWTDGSALARYTAVCHFVGAPAGPFTTIGWPGFAGVFSGIAPGRFAVTLNAVLSLEPPQAAGPVVFLLRTVLEEARSFAEARKLLSESLIPCDCLLLLTGTLPGEMVVIERTPSRHAVRVPSNGSICVTNGYMGLEAGVGRNHAGLFATWCQRLERVQTLLANYLPKTPEDCFRYLADPDVRLDITAQHIVFRAATGDYWTRLPHLDP